MTRGAQTHNTIIGRCNEPITTLSIARPIWRPDTFTRMFLNPLLCSSCDFEGIGLFMSQWKADDVCLVGHFCVLTYLVKPREK